MSDFVLRAHEGCTVGACFVCTDELRGTAYINGGDDALIEFRRFKHEDDYRRAAMATHAVKQNVKHARKAGLVFHQFEWKNHLVDIVDINTSTPVRQGRPMGASYSQTVEQRGGLPSTILPIAEPPCPVHWGLAFGVFRPESGHKQGDLVVNERLLGYCWTRRAGNLAMTSMVLGHDAHLRLGTMHLLFVELGAWMIRGEQREAKGIEAFLYGQWSSGQQTLQDWKRRLGFLPVRVVEGGS